ncbi:MAG: radical SAM/SPASM domain-containing protein [Erysipelotrichaceae bacterium]|nr:radical SAM/SPASM domain-containing protein [Erysipelotrichaceae bacterium]
MKKRFHHIYVEITNQCQLNCSFCPKSKREIQWMQWEQFQMIVQQIVPFTDMIYLHVMGEPLLHPQVIEMIRYANQRGLMVGITTNGLMLPKLVDQFHDMQIKRWNLSLHSYYDQNNQCMEQLPKTVEAVDQMMMQLSTTVFYRLWDMDHPQAKTIAEYLKNHYQNPTIELTDTDPNGIALKHRVRLQFEHKFTWPIDATQQDETGFCQGLRSHVAILVNGDVVPCCLDNEGTICLGNCFTTPFEEILHQPLAKAIYQGFSERKVVHPLCSACSYKQRFEKKGRTNQ